MFFILSMKEHGTTKEIFLSAHATLKSAEREMENYLDFREEYYAKETSITQDNRFIGLYHTTYDYTYIIHEERVYL